jgi:hypothetical protein
MISSLCDSFVVSWTIMGPVSYHQFSPRHWRSFFSIYVFVAASHSSFWMSCLQQLYHHQGIPPKQYQFQKGYIIAAFTVCRVALQNHIAAVLL